MCIVYTHRLQYYVRIPLESRDLALLDKRELLYYNSVYFTLKEKMSDDVKNSCSNLVLILLTVIRIGYTT